MRITIANRIMHLMISFTSIQIKTHKNQNHAGSSNMFYLAIAKTTSTTTMDVFVQSIGTNMAIGVKSVKSFL